jgi:hypothetical protein
MPFPRIPTPALGVAAALLGCAAVAATVTDIDLGADVAGSIETVIEIDAPPGVVWATFSDTDSYGDWNPMLRRVSGEWTVGQTLDVSLGDAAAFEMRPRVVVARDAAELRWVTAMGWIPGLFDAEHFFILEDTGSGTTRLRHGETVSGFLAYIVRPRMSETTRLAFGEMNAALKAQVEAHAGT